jgi:nitronate monooxygenase
MIQTEITAMFGIKYPIICGAMMWSAKPPLCAAISNAGGMGNLTAANFETEEKVLKAWETGDVNSAPMMVGQSIGLIHSVPTCAELLDTMIAEAKECLQKTTALMQTP